MFVTKRNHTQDAGVLTLKGDDEHHLLVACGMLDTRLDVHGHGTRHTARERMRFPIMMGNSLFTRVRTLYYGK